MPFKSGVVEALYFDEVDADKYGNTFKRAAMIGGERFIFGKSKQPRISVKIGKNYEEIKVGDTVELRYEENEFQGKIYNMADISSMARTAAATVRSAENATKGKSGAGQDVASKPVVVKKFDRWSEEESRRQEVSIKVGHAVNNAVNMAIATGNADDIGVIEKFAWDILKLSEKLNNLYVSPTKEASAPQDVVGATSSNTAHSKSVSVTEDFDDDLPF